MQNIQMERKLEFTGEYIRKYDLMRWGILADALLNAVDLVPVILLILQL